MNNLGFIEDVRENHEQNEKEKERSHTYDEAIAAIGTGKFHVFHFLISGLSVMTVVIETLCIGLVMPVSKCDMKFSVSEQGVLASSGFLGVVLSSHMWGFLADTWGRKRAVHLSVSLASVFTVISAFSVNVWMFAAFRFLTGFAISGCQAATYTYVGEFHGPKTRPKYIAYVSTFLPLGMIYLAAVALLVLPFEIDWLVLGLRFTSWRLFMLIGSIPTYVSSLSYTLLPESPKYLLIQGKHEKALDVLRKCFKWNLSKPAEEYPVTNVVIAKTGGSLADVKGFFEGVRLVWNQTIPIFNRSRVWVSLNLNFVQFVTFFVAHGVFMWLPSLMATMLRNIQNDMTFCESIMDYPSNTTSHEATTESLCSEAVDLLTFQIIMYMAIGYTVCYTVIGVFINKVGKKRLLVLWLTAAGLATLGIRWAEGLYFICALIFISLAIGNAGGIVSSISIDYYPANINAMAFCFVMMSGRFGAVAGSNFVGVVLNHNCNTLFLLLGGFVLISAVCSLVLPSKHAEAKCIDVVT